MLATAKRTNPKLLRCRNATWIANNNAILIDTLTTSKMQCTSYCNSLKQPTYFSTLQHNHEEKERSLFICGYVQKYSIPRFDAYGKHYNVRFFSKTSSAESFLSLGETKVDTDPSQTRQQNTKQRTTKNVQYDRISPERVQYMKLNSAISRSNSCDQVLRLIEHVLDKNAGGGLLDSICFATILTRLARYMPHNITDRERIITDHRFSQLFACLAEAFVSANEIDAHLKHYSKGIRFGSRDTASIGYAIAKLGIVVPRSKLPMMDMSLQSEYNAEASQTLSATAKLLRESISLNSYNSKLPTLSSQILDYIGFVVSTNINAHTYGNFDVRNCATLYWAWAAADRADPKVFEQVAVLMNKRIHQLLKSGSIDTIYPQDISNTLWAMAAADVYTGPHQVKCIELVTQLMQNDNVFLRTFSPQALSNSAWAISKLASVKKTLSDQNSGYPVVSVLTERIQQSADTITRIVATEVLQRHAAGFTTQELSNTALSFARVDSTDIVLMRHATQIIMENSLQTLRQFNGQQASNLVMAVAQLFQSNSNIVDNLFHRVGNHLLDRNVQVQPKSISMTLLAFSSVKFPDRSVYRNLIGRFNQIDASLCSAEDLTQMIHAVAKAGGVNVQNKLHPIKAMPSQPNANTVSHRQLSVDPTLHCCAIVANEFMQRSHEFSIEDIAITCGSFATLRIKDATFLTKVEQEIKSRMGNIQEGKGCRMTAFRGSEVANILWAFAILNGDDSNLLQVFEPYILEMCRYKTGQNIQTENIAKVFNRHSLSSIAWACAVFGKFPDELMKILYIGQFGHGAVEDSHHLSKIYGDGGLPCQTTSAGVYVQVAMGLVQSKNGLSLPINFPDDWIQSDGSSTSEQSEVGWEAITSNLQKNISHSLHSVGFDHVSEYIISMQDLADNYCFDIPRKDLPAFSMDMANIERKIAIEVDGPYHYLLLLDSDSLLRRLKNGQTLDENSASIKYVLSGSTMLKVRLLTLMGWKVLGIPWWEWDNMEGNEEKQKEYCIDRLQELQE